MWKSINKYSVTSPTGEENIFLEFDGTNYRIRNEFGNMFFEFDLVSGLFFTQKLADDIESDAADEVVRYLNEISKEESDGEMNDEHESDLPQEQEDVDV